MALSLPVILANAIQTLYGVADMYWVSRLADGDAAIGAINFVGPVINTAMAFGIGMNIAGTSLISQFIGLGKLREAKDCRAPGQLFPALSVALAVLGLLFGRQLLVCWGLRAASWSAAGLISVSSFGRADDVCVLCLSIH